MDQTFIIVVIIVFLADFALFGTLWFLGAWSRANRPEGVNRRQIGDGTGKPNCVSSLASAPRYQIDPISYRGDANESWGNLIAAVEDLPGTQIITNDPPYLYAESFSKIFGFVDDLEILQDGEEKLFHVRSASRVGYTDMGANRKRVEALRENLGFQGKSRCRPEGGDL